MITFHRRAGLHPALPSIFLGLGCSLLALAPQAHAARPMTTDDARVTEAKTCQVESWARKNRGSTEYWALPACNPTGNLELTAGGARTHDDAGSFLTDAVLQMKTVVKPLDTNGWGLAASAGTVRHPRERENHRDWYVNVPASFSFRDDQFVLYTNAGWLRQQAGRRDRLTWGVGSEIQLNQQNYLIAETFGQNQGKPSYQFGLRHWLVPNRVQVDATYGNRFGRSTEERWFSIGVRLLSPVFLP